MTSANSENLIKVLGIESLSDDQKIRIVDAASALVEQNLMIRVMESLTEAKRQEMIRILNSPKSEQLNSFILNEIPDFPDWVVEETLKVKQDLGDFAKAQE